QHRSPAGGGARAAEPDDRGRRHGAVIGERGGECAAAAALASGSGGAREMKGDHVMTIGQASASSGVPPKTIRFYEELGLVKPAERLANRYRAYDESNVQTLRFIRRARELGFSLQEIDGSPPELDHIAADTHSAVRSHLEVQKRRAPPAHPARSRSGR